MTTEPTASRDEDSLDPMVIDIVEGAIESALRQMDAQVDRTARSTVIREANEHVPAIYDAHGRSVASVAFTANVDPILERWRPEEVREGDVFIWNHPYQSCGGIGHVPDICLTVPVFFEGTLIAYVQEMGHVQDIGGMVVGSMSQAATEVFQEGLLLPPAKLIERGKRNQALHEVILANTRFPSLLEGDIDAMIGACRLGCQRIQWLCSQYGANQVVKVFESLLDRCADSLRSEVVAKIPEGQYHFEDYVEYVDVSPAEPRQFIRISLTTRREGNGLVFDFTGTDEEVAGAINFPADERFYARALVTTFKSFIPEGLVINDGILRVVDVVLPPGTVLSPEFPAACGYRHYPLIRSFSVALGTLARAMKGQVPMGADNMSGISFNGTRVDDGTAWYLTMPLGGGSCGRPFADGLDTVLMTPGRNVPVEFIETYYPLRLEEYGLNVDSGGAGFHRGGLGYRMIFKILEPMKVSVRTDRHYLQPTGVNGGRAGKGAEFIVDPGTPNQRRLPGKCDSVQLEPGQRLLVTSPGGGGWGDPLERPTEQVALDLRRGIISAKVAANDYGVVPDDPEGSKERRAQIASRRSKPGMFDRGERFEMLVREREPDSVSDSGARSQSPVGQG